MKILIVKTSSLGDIVQTFPVLTYLRDKFSDLEIDWVVEASNAELVRAHPFVDKVIVVDTKCWRRSFFKVRTAKEMCSFFRELKQKKYDLLFDFQGNTKSGLITLLASATTKVGFAKENVAEFLNIIATSVRYNLTPGKNIREDYLSLVQQYFGDKEVFNEDRPVKLAISKDEKKRIQGILDHSVVKERAITLVCPGSAWENKRLSIEHLRLLLKRIANDEPSTVFLFAWGSTDERILCESLYHDFSNSSIVIEKLPLSVLQNLMWQVNRVIALDSLPLHLAGTTETETISFFGPSSAKKYAPLGAKHVFYQGSCPYNVNFEKRCPKLRTCTTGACLKDIEIEVVYQTIKNPR